MKCPRVLGWMRVSGCNCYLGNALIGSASIWGGLPLGSSFTYDDPSARAWVLIHERPPGVPTTRILPLAPLVLNNRPKHLWSFVRCIGHPQVDSLQKRTSPACPIVYLVVCHEPELSDSFLTGTHPFHHFCWNPFCQDFNPDMAWCDSFGFHLFSFDSRGFYWSAVLDHFDYIHVLLASIWQLSMTSLFNFTWPDFAWRGPQFLV